MPDKILPIRLQDDWHAAIDAEHKKLGMTKSEFIRDVLGRSLRSRGYQLSDPPKWGGSRLEQKSENS